MDKRPTLNYVLPEIAFIRMHVANAADDDHSILALKKTLRKYMDELQTKRISIVHHAATALTPPFRTLLMCDNSADKLLEVKAYLRVMMREVRPNSVGTIS